MYVQIEFIVKYKIINLIQYNFKLRFDFDNNYSYELETRIAIGR